RRVDVTMQSAPPAADRELAKADAAQPELVKPGALPADTAKAEAAPDVAEPTAPKQALSTESTAAAVVAPVPAASPALPPRVAQATPSAPAQPSVRESITHTGSNGGKLLPPPFNDPARGNVPPPLPAQGGRHH